MLHNAFILINILMVLSLITLVIESDIKSDTKTQYKIVKTIYGKKLAVLRYSNLYKKVTLNKYKINDYFSKYVLAGLLKLVGFDALYIFITNIRLDNKLIELLLVIITANLIYDCLNIITSTIKVVYNTNIKEEKH